MTTFCPLFLASPISILLTLKKFPFLPQISVLSSPQVQRTDSHSKGVTTDTSSITISSPSLQFNLKTSLRQVTSTGKKVHFCMSQNSLSLKCNYDRVNKTLSIRENSKYISIKIIVENKQIILRNIFLRINNVNQYQTTVRPYVLVSINQMKN